MKYVLKVEDFDVLRLNTFRVVAQIATSDFQLSLPFSPAESGLNLDFNCLADHVQTIQSSDKCGSCHCIFRLLQTFYHYLVGK